MDSVYLETSVISYLVAAPSRDLVVAAHQQVTRDWWNAERANYELYVSQMVYDEAARGDAKQAALRLAMIDGMTRLDVNDPVRELAEAFIDNSSLPQSAIVDASHIAVATVMQIDFLMTWNCRHIANAHILKKLSEIANTYGYDLPVVCTPLELSGREDEL